MKKRLLSILLMCCMVLTLLPTTAFAEGSAEEPPVCSCETACTADNMNKECPVCGAENAIPQNCGQYIPVEDRTGENGSTERADDPNGPIELSAADQVQAMINGLPNAEEITEDNAEEVKAQLEAIDEAKEKLSDEEIDELDMTRYAEAAAALGALAAPMLLANDSPDEQFSLKPGDTYYRIATARGTSVRAMLTANPNQNPNLLIPGQYLNVPYGFPVVPADVPFSSELLQICVQGLLVRYPFLSQKCIARTAWGRPVTALRIGQGPRCALYNASHHANEWITTPVLLLFLEQYAYAVATEGRILGMDAQQLWRRTTLWLVPMVNPDGVDLVTGAIRPGSQQYQAAQRIAAGFPEIPFPGGWKANLTGTDLNLNYPAGWEQARTNKFALGFTGPAPRDYVGASPLDQPETAAMAALTQAIRPDVTLSYHTQGEEIYWRFQDYAPPGAQELGERLARVSGYRLEDTPFASGFAGYKDWFLQDFRRPGYTIEAGLGTNPLPLSQFDEIYRRNISILVHALP